MAPPRVTLWAAVILLAANVGIMLTGGLVRVSGSGLGCSNWPKCETRLTPTELHTPTVIEFGNRMLSIALGIAVLLALVALLSRVPFRKDLLRLGLVILAGVLFQGVLGGLSVLYDLDWAWISAHYMGSIVLILIPATVLVWRAGQGIGNLRNYPVASKVNKIAIRVSLVVGLLALVMGTLATAAGPNSGGEGTGDIVKRLDIKGTDTLHWMVQRHGVVAGAFGVSIAIAWILAGTTKAPKPLQRTLTVAGLLVGLQGVLGLVQYANKLPAGLVWLHIAVATTTWVALLWAWQQAEGQRADPAEGSGATA